MAVELARRGFLDHRRALLGWCIGIVGYVALVVSIFPSIKGSADFEKLVQNYPDALKSLFGISGGGDITSGAGFVDAELFSLMLPLLVLVLAIGSGARTFAGEEEAGRLELILSYPLRRRNAVLAKGSALALEIVIVCAVGFAALAVLDGPVGLGLDFGRLAGCARCARRARPALRLARAGRRRGLPEQTARAGNSGRVGRGRVPGRRSPRPRGLA